jgi:hypothetical protein
VTSIERMKFFLWCGEGGAGKASTELQPPASTCTVYLKRGATQWDRHLPSMHEAPGSSPNATHKKVQLEVIKKKKLTKLSFCGLF